MRRGNNLAPALARIEQLAGTKTIQQLADAIGITRAYVFHCGQRDALPFKAIIKTAEKKNWDLNFIFYGKAFGSRAEVIRVAARAQAFTEVITAIAEMAPSARRPS